MDRGSGHMAALAVARTCADDWRRHHLASDRAPLDGPCDGVAASDAVAVHHMGLAAADACCHRSFAVAASEAAAHRFHLRLDPVAI